MDVQQFLNALPPQERDLVQPGASLRELTTLRVGGPAALVCPIHTPDQARRFQAVASEAGSPQFILGGGSNILADDLEAKPAWGNVGTASLATASSASDNISS